MPWNYENLWQKAKTYFERGFNEDRTSELFGIWSSLGLELLARATLANIHPTLLADPQQGDNIMHACGYPQGKKPPRSVPINLVFQRCTVIIPEYTEADFKFCLSLMEKRNSELHSGESPFIEYPTSIWLPKFLKVCKIFTEFQNKSLIDLLGEEDAKAAESNIEAELNNRKKEVNKLIQEHKKKFDALEIDDRLEKLKESKKTFGMHGLKERHKCPSCGASAVVEGEAVKYLEAKVEEDGIVEPIICLPTKFKCYCCGLTLSNHIDVYAAGFGDQFTVDQWNDPKDYYQIEFDPSDYYDDERY